MKIFKFFYKKNLISMNLFFSLLKIKKKPFPYFFQKKIKLFFSKTENFVKPEDVLFSLNKNRSVT